LRRGREKHGHGGRRSSQAWRAKVVDRVQKREKPAIFGQKQAIWSQNQVDFRPFYGPSKCTTLACISRAHERRAVQFCAFFNVLGVAERSKLHVKHNENALSFGG